MNDNLSFSAAMNIAKNVPCSAQVIKILKTEYNLTNYVESFDKISMQNDESYFILKFGNESKYPYPNLKTLHKKDGSIYQVLALVDEKGCVEIRFKY